MGNYGIKITEPGNAVTETSPGKYRYHSSYPLLKIKGIYTGHGHVNFNVLGTVATISHSLGYAPMFDVMIALNSVESEPSTYYPQSFFELYPTLGDLQYCANYSDNTNLYVKYFAGGGGVWVYYKAVIYYDPINP